MIEKVIETVIENKILALMGGGGVVSTYLLRGGILKVTSVIVNYVLIDLMAKFMPKIFKICILDFMTRLNNFLERKKKTRYGRSYTEFENQLITCVDETKRILSK